jgi:hypothetical protein
VRHGVSLSRHEVWGVTTQPALGKTCGQSTKRLLV